MKSWLKLIFLGLTATTASLVLWPIISRQTPGEADRNIMTARETTLTYVRSGRQTTFSLSPLDSDFLDNLTVMEQTVGTLIKYGGRSLYEPYLAERWEVSVDGKVWTFFLRDGLKLDDGSPVLASAFVNGLRRALRSYLATSTPPIFDQLEGWGDFAAGKEDAIGIRSIDDKTIEFRFERSPREGFLEFLSMPYYGYYDPSDWDGLKWKDPKQLKASGAYRALPMDDDRSTVILEKRQNWFSHIPGSPDRIIVKQMPLDEAVKAASSDPMVVLANSKDVLDDVRSTFIPVMGARMMLTTLILSPYVNNIFNDTEVRRIFASEVRKSVSSMPPPHTVGSVAQRFYETAPQRVAESESNRLARRKPTRPVKVAFTGERNANVRLTYIEQLLDKVFKELAWEVQFVYLKATPENDERLLSNREFDARVDGVDTGSAVDVWTIKMMFCSRLGVSFPDPEGNVCRLVEAFENQKPPMSYDDYNRDFHDIVDSDASVLPVLRWGQRWLFTNEIDLTYVSPTMGIPRFDLLAIRR